MKVEVKFIVYIFLVFSIIGFVFLHNVSKYSISNKESHMNSMYGSIEFSGSIQKIHSISRWGRTYGIACVVLDYSNIDDFYNFDKISAFKIHNGVASIPIGPVGNISDELVIHKLKSTYVEVNLNNSGEIVFIDREGKSEPTELWFGSNNLVESDLNICD